MPDKLTVMIRSTTRDLPEYRKQIMEAWLRQVMFPIMMEHLPASDADAVAVPLGMVIRLKSGRSWLHWLNSAKCKVISRLPFDTLT